MVKVFLTTKIPGPVGAARARALLDLGLEQLYYTNMIYYTVKHIT